MKNTINIAMFIGAVKPISSLSVSDTSGSQNLFKVQKYAAKIQAISAITVENKKLLPVSSTFQSPNPLY